MMVQKLLIFYWKSILGPVPFFFLHQSLRDVDISISQEGLKYWKYLARTAYMERYISRCQNWMKILTLCTTITLELSKNCLTIRHVEVSYMFIILNSAQFKLLNFALNKDNIFPNQFLENLNLQQKFIIFSHFSVQKNSISYDTKIKK